MLADHLQNNDITNRSTLLIFLVGLIIGPLWTMSWMLTGALCLPQHVPGQLMTAPFDLLMTASLLVLRHLLEYLILMIVTPGHPLATIAILHLLRLATCELLRHLSLYKMSPLVRVLQIE